MTEHVIALIGQSNMGGLWSQSTNPPSANSNATMWNGSSWVTPTGNGLITFCNKILDNLSVGDTIKVLPYAAGGSSLHSASASPSSNYWLNTASGSPYDDFVDGIDSSGKTPDMILWFQGEQDYWQTTTGQYKTGLTTLYNNILTHISKTASQVPFICGITGKNSTNNANGPYIRQAQMEWSTTTTGAVEGPTNYDIDTTDGVHHNAAGYERLAKRFAQSVLHVLGIKSHSAVGAKITSVDRIGNKLLAVVQHNKGTTLYPENPWEHLTGFRVWKSDFSVEYTVTRADAVSPLRIKLFTNIDPGVGAHVAFQWDDDDSIVNVPYADDNPLGDAIGLPIMPTPKPIVVNS